MRILWKKVWSLVLAAALLLSAVPLQLYTVKAEESEAEQPLFTEPVTLSILGDSISTYQNYSNGTAAETANSTITDGAIYYPRSGFSVTAENTWWYQTAEQLGMEILVNNSWSGSCLLNTRSGTVGAYVDRCVQLHDDTGDNTGEEPDIIAIYLGTNDYYTYPGTLGSYEAIDFDALITETAGIYTYAAPTTSLEAYAISLHKIAQRYPDAEVYCFTLLPRVNSTNQPTAFNEDVKQLAAYFDAFVVDLYDCGIDSDTEAFYVLMGDSLHPDVEGMDAITGAFTSAILKNSRYVPADTVIRDVTYSLTDVVVKQGTDWAVVEGQSYQADLVALGGGPLQVKVTMAGADVTESCYANGKITVDKVTGDLVITAQSKELVPELDENRELTNFRWEYDTATDSLISVSTGYNTENPLSMTHGSINDGTFSKTRFTMTQTVMLNHDRPWSIEWRSSGTWSDTTDGALLFAQSNASATANSCYLYRRHNNTWFALGIHENGKYHNYGASFADTGIDTTAEHVYRLTNRIADDGSNMVYLYVDDVEIGPMNHHYIGGTDQKETSDWVSGKDFRFSYMGTTPHTIGNCTIDYIQVWEDGQPEQRELSNFHWEYDSQTDSFASIMTDGNAANALTLSSGSVTGGILTGARFSLQSDVQLYHDVPWVVEWRSAGNWSGMLFGSTLESPSDGLTYLFRDTTTKLFAFGEYNGSWNNYGIVSDCDMTVSHVFRLENRIAAYGTNTVYLVIDDQEIGAMTQYYIAGKNQNENVNWANGKDIVFSNLGTSSHPINRMKLDYLRIWEGGHVHSYESTVTAPTCTEAGYTTHTCAACGGSYVDSYVNATDHAFGNWMVTTEPTDTQKGEERRDCGNCDYFEIREINAGEHRYEAVVTLPTETEQGYTVYTCSLCGDSYRTLWLDETAYEGKTIACVGDSITAGVGVTKDETDYVKLLAEQLGMDYIRLGASGTTLCADGSRTCNISKLTEGYLKGADVVTIAMGINDFVAAGVGYYELGDIQSTDTSTIYGAARMWCERIVELRKTDSLSHTQFYFVTPVICSWNNSVTANRNWDQSKTNVHGYTLRDLCNAIMEMAALYDVAVIDLNLLSGMYYNDVEDNNTAVFGGDGVHPGEKGHEMMAGALANALLQNDLRDDHAHTFGSWITTTWPSCFAGEQQRVCTVCSATESRTWKQHNYCDVITAPTCTEAGYTTHTCTDCGDSYVDDRVDAAGHTYENGICLACGAEHPNLTDYSGKVISIMGDSISTFAGYIPVADGFNREHLARYPQDNLLTDVNKTWWMQIVDQLDAKLGINDSWRGTTLSGAVPVTTGDTGENAAMSNLIRIQNLGSNGTPDVILLYGGTNDLAHVSKVGTFDPAAAPTEVDLTTAKWDNLADGFVHTLLRMRHYYPDTMIVAMLPTYTKSYYSDEKLAQGNEVMAQICEHYGIPYVDLRDSGVTAAHLPDGIHPGEEGMDLITAAVIDAMLEKCTLTAGEHTVYTVTHTLTNALASKSYYKGIDAGAAFTETLTGKNMSVRVTMGSEDITDRCYADGVIAIEEVTGHVAITVTGAAPLAIHLQPLPEDPYNMDLWPLLRHDRDYYSATGWAVHASASVKSVTIPVVPGERIKATSFGAAGTNGSSMNGIRVTFFSEEGVLISMTAQQVYDQFSHDGWLTVPEGAVAVNIPVWDYTNAQLYLLQGPAAVVVNADGSSKDYDDVADALLDAGSGATVRLLGDAAVRVVTVMKDVTLDLNGFALEADYVSCFGHIVDDSESNMGLLDVPATQFLIQSSNRQLPVRDGSGYRFFQVLPFNQKFVANENKYVFQPRFEEAAHELLLAGSEVTGVTVQVWISWKQNQGVRSQRFVYNQELVKKYLESYEIKKEDSYGQMLTLTLTGAQGLQELQFQAVVTSDTGVVVASTPILATE